MMWQKSCQVGTTLVWHGKSRAKLARLQYDMTESCQIGMSCAYEVVSNWHDLPKFVIFLNRPILVKRKKITHDDKKTIIVFSFSLLITSFVLSRKAQSFSLYIFLKNLMQIMYF